MINHAKCANYGCVISVSWLRQSSEQDNCVIQTELPESCCECRGGINNSRQLYFVDPELNVWFITQYVSDFYTFIQNMKKVKMPEWIEAKAHILQAGALVSAGVKQSSGI